ncbi:hypothetical protein, partial [Streptomyces sp. NPDC095602]|uniref:hypothetical protein n=1 Tax=Streptomyces sp. NPDC095602 TaxID=3155819 RepID=UPI00332CC443
LPFTINTDDGVNEERRLEYRFLDLRRERMHRGRPRRSPRSPARYCVDVRSYPASLVITRIGRNGFIRHVPFTRAPLCASAAVA